jgi:hypothetical protein
MTSTGVRFYASASTPATFDAVGYAALSWTEVNHITSIGESGPAREVVRLQILKDGRTQKFPGMIDDGSLPVEVAYDSADAGQNMLRANVKSLTNKMSFKTVFPDSSVDYDYGKVFTAPKNPGGANNIVGSSFKIEFEKEKVEVSA